MNVGGSSRQAGQDEKAASRLSGPKRTAVELTKRLRIREWHRGKPRTMTYIINITADNRIAVTIAFLRKKRSLFQVQVFFYIRV